ncbi:MAG: aspartyl protease family protein [Phycisphaerales bacterium]|nr:aspartyl protease family protein [Phycisphaerales bacterium]
MRAAVLLLLVLLAGCASPGNNTGSSGLDRAADHVTLPDGPGEHTIPSRRCGNYFLIDARINDRGPFTLLLDTGAAATVLSTRAADRLSDTAREADGYATGSQGQRQRIDKVVRINTLSAGEVQFKGFEAIALDLSAIQAVLGTRVDGILGFDAFRQVLLTVDYPNSSVRVARGRLPEPDGTLILPLARSDTPQVRVRIGDDGGKGGQARTKRLLLDTGKAGGFTFADFDEHRFSSPPTTVAMGVAIGGPFELRAGRLADDLVLGGITFRTPVVERSESSDLIGADALKTFAVTFDARSKRVRFQPAPPPTPPSSTSSVPIVFSAPVRGIGVGFSYAEGMWTVDRIFPDVPTDAGGLTRGDIVIRLGGKRLRELTCVRPTEMFETGDVIDVSVIRDRQRVDLRVPVITLVP